MSSTFLDYLAEHKSVTDSLAALDEVISSVAMLAVETLARGNKILLCGNGGSAADCQHIAAELVGRYVTERQPLAALALTTDSSILTSVGNDYTFDKIYSRQVSALGRPGDMLLAISTSGNSINVINAVSVCQSLGIKTVGLLGRGGGRLKDLCDLSVVVPSDTTARVQECHILIGHALCGLIEDGVNV